MTEPTQAQIEAAANAMREMPNLYAFGPPYLLEIAKAALTAAAGVGDEYLKEVNRELAAVALGIKDETIEQCAQVADGYPKIAMAMPTSVIDTVCGDIAAAIRALKDNP
jgi:hypothetical protein